jgi:hypothetical protein
MLKFEDIAPAIVADMQAQERALAEHRAKCVAEVCDQCGKRPRRAPSLDNPFVAADRSAALATLPRAFADARLDAPWLVELVGSEAMELAASSLGAKRAAFVGLPGAGKTSLAAAMFRAAVDVAKRPRWMRWTSSHALAKARATASLGDEAPLVERALQADLLVVDELGGEDQRHASAVAEVLYERHAENLATWITTGVTSQAIANRYGGGIARRIFEGATVFKLGGKR